MGTSFCCASLGATRQFIRYNYLAGRILSFNAAILGVIFVYLRSYMVVRHVSLDANTYWVLWTCSDLQTRRVAPLASRTSRVHHAYIMLFRLSSSSSSLSPRTSPISTSTCATLPRLSKSLTSNLCICVTTRVPARARPQTVTVRTDAYMPALGRVYIVHSSYSFSFVRHPTCAIL